MSSLYNFVPSEEAEKAKFESELKEANRAVEISRNHRNSIQHEHYGWKEKNRHENPDWHYKHSGDRLDRSAANGGNALSQAETHKARLLTDRGINLCIQGKQQEGLAKLNEALQCGIDGTNRSKIENYKNLAIQGTKEELISQSDDLRLKHEFNELDDQVEHEVLDTLGHRNWIREELYHYVNKKHKKTSCNYQHKVVLFFSFYCILKDYPFKID